MTGEEIKAALKVKIEEASTIDSSLCARLKEIDKWISQKKSGLLTAKKALMSFLVELLEDAEVYLYWEQTLKLWHIDRGVFYSYTSQNSAFLDRLVNTALHNSDHLESGRYLPIQYH